jgi:VWFA-related protein
MRALAAAALLLVPLHAAAQPRFHENVNVSRVLLDARVVDRAGDPILGLSTSDFRVYVDGRETPLDAVEWVAAAPSRAEGPARGLAARAGTAGAAGRLLVFVFQKDFVPSRLSGLMRMKEKAAAMLGTLTPYDRVAVLSFDSHLRVWCDFTSDLAEVRRIVERAVLFAHERRVEPGPQPSLVAHLDRAAAQRAAEPETALEVIARALRPVPGAKSLVWLGWGMGRFSFPDVEMGRDWGAAKAALAASRVTVFSLDITDADWHTLEFGLRTVAEATGGFYAKTHLFPDIAMARLEKALSGHYVLVLEPPEARGEHAVRVELRGRKGSVMVRDSFAN